MNFGDTQLNSSHPFGWSPGSFPRTCRSLPLRGLTIPLRQKLCCCYRRPAAQSRHGRGSVLQRGPGLPVASPAHSGASQTVLLSSAAWPPRPKACVSPTPEIQVRLSFVLGCSGWRVGLRRRGTPHTPSSERGFAGEGARSQMWPRDTSSGGSDDFAVGTKHRLTWRYCLAPGMALSSRLLMKPTTSDVPHIYAVFLPVWATGPMSSELWLGHDTCWGRRQGGNE